jgi:hypothetical protein
LGRHLSFLTSFGLPKGGYAYTRDLKDVIIPSSHLVEGTRMANYVKENRLKLQDPGDLIASFHEGKGLEFRAELSKMLKLKK